MQELCHLHYTICESIGIAHRRNCSGEIWTLCVKEYFAQSMPLACFTGCIIHALFLGIECLQCSTANTCIDSSYS
jgi:hypothetical protein